MQHDLFTNPSRQTRGVYPIVVALQADVADGDGQIVAPLTTRTFVPDVPSRAMPIISHDGRDFVILMRLLGFVPSRHLRKPIGSAARYCDDISRALDWLFFGI